MTAHVIDFAIYDRDTKSIYIQKRSANRRLYPDEWEVPGGHREDGESVEACIRRELKEELQLKDPSKKIGSPHETLQKAFDVARGIL